jgi:hypothetical protein
LKVLIYLSFFSRIPFKLFSQLLLKNTLKESIYFAHSFIEEGKNLVCWQVELLTDSFYVFVLKPHANEYGAL